MVPKTSAVNFRISLAPLFVHLRVFTQLDVNEF